jgi:N-acetylneuraminic acid mutarotase
MKKLQLKKLVCIIAMVYSFTARAQYSWTQMANFPGAARTEAACFSIGHYGYVGCGSTGLRTANFSDWWKWDQYTNRWSAIASYPGAAQLGCTYFAIGNKGYCGLGISVAGTATDLWSYDPFTDTWTAMASFPGAGRYSAFAFVIGTNAYIICGNPGSPTYLTDCWKYNSLTNTWSQIANYPVYGLETNLFYSIGQYGYAGCGGTGSTSTDVMYQFDTAANTWTAIASVPVDSNSGLLCPANFVLADTAYCVSGSDWLYTDFYNTTFDYNPNTNTWGNAATFPGIRRWYAVGFSIGNDGYVVTGNDSTGTPLADLWQYGPGGHCDRTVGGVLVGREIPEDVEGVNAVEVNNINLTVYPNPSNGMVNFSFGNLTSGTANLLITDVLGRTVSEYTLQGSQGNIRIDESQLSNGTYFYQITSNGGILNTGKLLIEK